MYRGVDHASNHHHAAAPSPWRSARQQDRAATELAQRRGRSQNPNDAEAGTAPLCQLYLVELRDRNVGRQIAEQGIRFAEKTVALKPGNAEYYRLLGTLYGQAITDIMSGLSYGPKAKDAINKAVEKAPRSSMMYVARGVGNYYVPVQLGGGAKLSIPDFQKAIELDPGNAEAFLWLGLSLRKENRDAEARQAFAKSLELNPNRLWAKQQLEKTPAK
jgi:tetratricopeptide (TPR) repeat protein